MSPRLFVAHAAENPCTAFTKELPLPRDRYPRPIRQQEASMAEITAKRRGKVIRKTLATDDFGLQIYRGFFNYQNHSAGKAPTVASHCEMVGGK